MHVLHRRGSSAVAFSRSMWRIEIVRSLCSRDISLRESNNCHVSDHWLWLVRKRLHSFNDLHHTGLLVVCVSGCVSLFVLRWRKVPAEPGAYRVFLFPVVPAIFCVACLFLIHSSLVYAIENRSYEAIWAIVFLSVGAVMSFFDPPIKHGDLTRPGKTGKE